MVSIDRNESSNSSISGKLVIISILLVALLGAGISWYFRYSATHQAAQFWNTGSAVLIRDAPQVTLHVIPTADESKSSIDISQGRGLVHLRNALLEDHNFIWPEVNQTDIAASGPLDWKWFLEFRDPKTNEAAALQFTTDCTLAARAMPSKERGSNRPVAVRTDSIMAQGLREMFGEFVAAGSADGGGAKPQAAGGAAKADETAR